MATASASTPTPNSRLAWLLLTGLILTHLTSAMTAVAIPTIIADLGIELERVGWVISAYLLPVVLMPVWGAAGDLYGRKRVYRAGVLIFGVGAAVSGTAGSLLHLLIGQATQAIGVAALQPNGTAMIADINGARGKGRALGRLRMFVSSAGIIGAPVSGLLIQALGWRSIFVLGPAVGLALWAIVGRAGAEHQPRMTTAPRFDLVGAFLVTVTLLTLLVTLSVGNMVGWTSPVTLGLWVAIAVGFGLIGPIEARRPHAMIPPALFRNVGYSAVILACLLQAFACFGTALLGPLLLQRVFGLVPAQAGWLLASFPLGMALSGIPGGRLTDRFGGRSVTFVSLVVVAAGLAILATTARLSLLPLFVPGAMVTGFAAGVGLTGMSWFVLQVNAESRHGVAMGVYSMVSIMGDAVGIALLTILLGGHEGAALADAFGQVYLVAAAVALLGLPATLLMRLGPAPEPVEPGRWALADPIAAPKEET